ncbi:MAG TPA: hypothetical protein VI819_05385 [Patescibacteria group bacterium]|nr:hypothetical protein [Patescibacteria group bacterium]
MKILKKWWFWLTIILLVIVLAVLLFNSSKNKSSSFTPSTPGKNQETNWKDAGVAVSGKYADADVLDLGNGKFRMYYSVEPEVQGNKLEMYSSVSSDGIKWTKEEGARKEFATFPDAVKLPDGTFRLYFQNAGVIKSAVSSDGLTWKDETGTRIGNDEKGFSLDNVGAQTTTQLKDGTYIIVYRGLENKPYGNEKLPNNTTSYFFYATSPDGINFTKKGIALDSRNSTLKGFVDGAEWVKWDDNDLRLYFWTYSGIYHINFQNGAFIDKPTFDFSNNPNQPMPSNPPGDPTLIKIGSSWYMYYGQHTKGIYYATLTK